MTIIFNAMDMHHCELAVCHNLLVLSNFHCYWCPTCMCSYIHRHDTCTAVIFISHNGPINVRTDYPPHGEGWGFEGN